MQFNRHSYFFVPDPYLEYAKSSSNNINAKMFDAFNTIVMVATGAFSNGKTLKVNHLRNQFNIRCTVIL